LWQVNQVHKVMFVPNEGNRMERASMKWFAAIRGWSKGWLIAPWLLGLAAPALFNVTREGMVHSFHSYVPLAFVLPGLANPSVAIVFLPQYLLMVGALFMVMFVIRRLMPETASALRSAGFAFLVPPVLHHGLWIYESNHHSTQEASVAAFRDHFPAVLQSPGTLTGIALLSSAAAACFLGLALSRSTGVWRGITLCALIAAVLLSLLALFQLM
jgi:hypothetical protein